MSSKHVSWGTDPGGLGDIEPKLQAVWWQGSITCMPSYCRHSEEDTQKTFFIWSKTDGREHT